MATLKQLLNLKPGRIINVSFDKRPEFLMTVGQIQLYEKQQLEFDFMGEDDVNILIQDLYEDVLVICQPIDVEILPEGEKMYV